jgi:hypothetical protein
LRKHELLQEEIKNKEDDWLLREKELNDDKEDLANEISRLSIELDDVK